MSGPADRVTVLRGPVILEQTWGIWKTQLGDCGVLSSSWEVQRRRRRMYGVESAGRKGVIIAVKLEPFNARTCQPSSRYTPFLSKEDDQR